MRILLLVVYYLPSTMSSAKLIHDLALEFRKRGHEPAVVAPDDSIPEDTELTWEEGIQVLRVRTGKIKTASRLTRGLNEAMLSRTIWEKGRRFFENRSFDLIVYYSPTIFFGSLVARLKARFACPSYLVLRDIFPQWAVDAGVLRRGLAYAYFKFKERQNYEAADIIGVQSPANLRHFETRRLDRKYRLEVLYNWTALEEDIRPGGNRQRLGLDGKVIFFYGGNIGVAQDVDNIVRLAGALRNESSAYFLLVGSGSEVPRLREVIASNGLTNIAIHDAVGQREYLALLAECDVGLISLDRGLRTQNFPGKMLGYMYHSMPMLASVNPGNDLKTLLEDHEAGLVCINGDDEVLAAHARRLAADRELRQRLGKNARSLLENTFSVTRAADRILAHFEKRN
ncbi:MAG TPA: glycosyltransferase family 4 protein [Syntrophales bacterium]|jgi:glycosyltransferase involved in cell wall biosynthesis|nr:glycosyltransferase family 4 protein [Syntrophales bacterium]